MATTTITCPKCGHPTPYAPEHWIDVGNWAGGRPTHIACARCGEMVPLPGGGARFTRLRFLVLVITLGLVTASIAVAVIMLAVEVLHG